jgi:hypothetical protein
MYRAITIALAGTLLLLAPTAVFARGGGGHGGGGFGGGGHGGGGFAASFGGGHGGFSGGHSMRAFSAVHGPVGFRPMHGIHGNKHVVVHRFPHRRVFIGGFGGDYYYCYPVWNGYVWVNSCNYDY